MRKLIIIVAAFVAFAATSSAQSYRIDGKTIIEQKQSKAANEIKTGFTLQSDGVTYDVYMNTNSTRCYVYKTSKKTGKQYKKYLSEEIEREICKALNIEYKPRKQKEDK